MANVFAFIIARSTLSKISLKFFSFFTDHRIHNWFTFTYLINNEKLQQRTIMPPTNELPFNKLQPKIVEKNRLCPRSRLVNPRLNGGNNGKQTPSSSPPKKTRTHCTKNLLHMCLRAATHLHSLVAQRGILCAPALFHIQSRDFRREKISRKRIKTWKPRCYHDTRLSAASAAYYKRGMTDENTCIIIHES